MDQFNHARPRNITPVEAIAALLVLCIWSAVFLAAVVVALTYLRNQPEQTVVAQMPTRQVAVVASVNTPVSTKTFEEATAPPTRRAAELEALPTLTPTGKSLLSETPVNALAKETIGAGTTPVSMPASEPAAPTVKQPVPTPTFTRVIPPTTSSEKQTEPTATPTLTPTFTPMPTYTIIPTYVYPAQVAMAVDGSLVHSVSAGETLSGIAGMYGTSLESLIQANQIDNPARISVGQKLTIPHRQEMTSVKAALLPGVEPAANSPSNPVPAPTLPVDMSVPPPPAGDPPTRLVIPKINLDVPVIEVGWRIIDENGRRFSEWDVADYVAGWHRGSAFPGNVGNTVISGHHNIKGEIFRYLVDLEKGDLAYLYVNDQLYPYVVTEKHILREKGMSDEVRSQNARWIAKTTDERVTLVTCWPYTNNTHRVILVARPAWK